MTSTRDPRFFRMFCIALAMAFVPSLLKASEAPDDDDPPGPRTARLPSDELRNGDRVRQVFRPAVKVAANSTARIVSKKDDSQKDLALAVIIDADGLALTKASELDEEFACRLSDGRVIKAKQIASDAESDLALIQLQANGLTPIVWSEKSARVGQWLATVSQEATPAAVGVVSVLAREIKPEKGILGIAVTEDEPGPKVTEVIAESGAERAGLKIGDLILDIGGAAIPDVAALLEILAAQRPGTSIALTVRRENETKTVNATLGRRPAERPDRGEFQNALGGELSLRRDGFSQVIQHDTVLRPEDCGGPVVDIRGEVVGLNIARAGRTESYAIPTASLRPLIERLRSKAAAIQVNAP